MRSLDIVSSSCHNKKDFRREELPEKFMAKMLYGWDDRKFEEEYLRKLERNWKSVFLEEKP